MKDCNDGFITIENNTIHTNGWNGLEFDKSEDIVLIDNTISNNGLTKGGGNSGYGLVVQGPFRCDDPLIILTDNQFCNNNGQIHNNHDSADLGNYDLYLNADDSGNVTTCGCEGPGIIGPCPNNRVVAPTR